MKGFRRNSTPERSGSWTTADDGLRTEEWRGRLVFPPVVNTVVVNSLVDSDAMIDGTAVGCGHGTPETPDRSHEMYTSHYKM